MLRRGLVGTGVAAVVQVGTTGWEQPSHCFPLERIVIFVLT